MPKLFVVSDIHGFYDELCEALDNAGFNPENEQHLLVVCGDTTDRGSQPSEVISYLSNLMQKNKCVVVKGNHESLVVECCKRGYPEMHDYSNGTFDTICDIGGAGGGCTFEECIDVAEIKFKSFVNKMVNYFETKNYIFVHSFIPLISKDGLPMYYTKNRKFAFNPDWRYAHASDWEEARWGNPFDLAEKGFLPDKTLVFGHWATEHKWAEVEGRKDFDKDAHFDIYYGDGYIGIDATTAYSKKVNVLVLEDEFLNKL